MARVETTLKDVNMISHKIDNIHAESILPGNKNWKLVWNDEFDGDRLDETKWNYRLHYWGVPSPTFTKEGVCVKDSLLNINLVRKGDNFYSAHLQTGSLTFDIPADPAANEGHPGFWPFGPKQEAKFMHGYGYYEIRCRLPKGPGWHAAFWLQAPGIGSHPNPEFAGVECDIMENYAQHTKGRIVCGNGWGGYGAESKWGGHFSYPYEETADGWHYYGVHWSEHGYTFYADGKEVGKQLPPRCPVSKIEQFILVSTECHGYNRYFAEIGGAGNAVDMCKPSVDLFTTYPDKFVVDFVRVYDEV